MAVTYPVYEAGTLPRYKNQDWLNIGTAESPSWKFLGTGWTQIDESFSPQMTSKRYVNDVVASSNITTYEWTAPFTADMIVSDEAIRDVVDIGRELKTGANAVREYCKVDCGKQLAAGVYPARKFKVAVEVADITDNDGELQFSGNFHGMGDPVKGYATLSNSGGTTTLTFTAGEYNG